MIWTLKLIYLKKFLHLIFSNTHLKYSYLKNLKPEKQEFKLYAKGWYLSNSAELQRHLIYYPEPYLDEIKYIYYTPQRHRWTHRERSENSYLPSTQEGRFLVVPATFPGRQEHLTVCDRSSMRFLLQHLCAAITSHVPPSGERERSGMLIRDHSVAIQVCACVNGRVGRVKNIKGRVSIKWSYYGILFYNMYLYMCTRLHTRDVSCHLVEDRHQGTF